MGARKIGITTLPPTGCLPAAITLFGRGSNQCVARLNQDAIFFKEKLNRTSENLRSRLPGKIQRRQKEHSQTNYSYKQTIRQPGIVNFRTVALKISLSLLLRIGFVAFILALLTEVRLQCHRSDAAGSLPMLRHEKRSQRYFSNFSASPR